MASSIVQFRIDDELKNQASEVFDELGMDMSTALRIFLKKTVAERGIPFSLSIDEKKKENHLGKL